MNGQIMTKSWKTQNKLNRCLQFRMDFCLQRHESNINSSGWRSLRFLSEPLQPPHILHFCCDVFTKRAVNCRRFMDSHSDTKTSFNGANAFVWSKVMDPRASSTPLVIRSLLFFFFFHPLPPGVVLWVAARLLRKGLKNTPCVWRSERVNSCDVCWATGRQKTRTDLKNARKNKFENWIANAPA